MGPDQLPEGHDENNPYAPPRSAAAPAPAPAPGPLVAMPFTVNDVFNWELVDFHGTDEELFVDLLGVFGLDLAISLVLNLVQDGVLAGVRDENMYRLLYILSLFAAYVSQAWLAVGMTLAMIKIARGEPVAFEDVLKGGRFLLTTILASIVHKLLIAVPIVVATGVITGGLLMMENQSGVAAFLLFLVLSGSAGLVFIYLAARLAMYYYLVIDRDAGVFESLQQSWRLCRNHVGTITLVYCVEFAVLLAGLLACVVGLIPALPLIGLLDAVTYLALVSGATSGEKKPVFLWAREAT